jgi:hypothetical protein
MSNQHFGLHDDPFADAHELTVAEATRLLRGRITAAGGDGTRLFPDETCAELHRLSSGRRGGIFALAGRAMKIAARAGARNIEPAHAQTAASEAGHDTARAVARRAESAPPAPAATASDAEAGGFLLPSEPSRDLDPGAREWVGRFMATPGPGIAPAARREPEARVTKKPRVEPAAKTATEPVAKAAEPQPKAAAPPKATGPLQPDTPVAKPTTAEPSETATQDAPPPPPAQLSAATSARLREGRRSRSRRQRALVQGAVGAVAVFALGVVVMNRLPGNSQKPAARVPAATTATATAPTAGPVAPPATSITPPGVTTKASAPPTVPPASPHGGSAEEERVGLEVATYIFRERAEDERQRLVAAGYRARVKTAWENGAPSYRVIVGPYRSWEAAERAADDLLGTGMVGQARAIKL